MAQLYEKVELRGESELLKIQQLLDKAVARRVQDAGEGELTDEDRQELLAASTDFVAQLRQFVVFAEDESAGGEATTRTQLTPAAASLALHSPMLKPLSPPPVDAEVQQLEDQVTEASLRVAELRTSMQARLQDQLAAKLAACRPTADLEPPAAGGGQQPEAGNDAEAAAVQWEAGTVQPETADAAASAEAQQQEAAAAAEQDPAAPQAQAGEEEAQHQQMQQDAQPMDTDAAEQQKEHVEGVAAAVPPEQPAIPLSPQPQELQQRLLQAANKMPALRARLEQATERLQRVVAAVSADLNRPPPNTVEKAVLGKTPGKPTAAAAAAAAAAAGEENVPGVSPLFKQALESGQISTRRRGSRDVQPVPFGDL